MIEIRHKFTFNAAHRLDRLPDTHQCHRLHGHTYHAHLFIAGGLDDMGMVIDYDLLAQIWHDNVHNVIDHRYLNDIIEIPTTELVVQWIFHRVAPLVQDKPGRWPVRKLTRVILDESVDTSAEYRP